LVRCEFYKYFYEYEYKHKYKYFNEYNDNQYKHNDVNKYQF